MKYFVDATLKVKVSDLLVETDDDYSRTLMEEISEAIEKVLAGRLIVSRAYGRVEGFEVESVDNWNSQ